MACCLTAPSHYLNQCWLTISKVQWHLSQGNFTRHSSAMKYISLKNFHLKFHSNFPGATELNTMLASKKNQIQQVYMISSVFFCGLVDQSFKPYWFTPSPVVVHIVQIPALVWHKWMLFEKNSAFRCWQDKECQASWVSTIWQIVSKDLRCHNCMHEVAHADMHLKLHFI